MDRIADYEVVRSLGQGNHGEFFLAVPPPRLRVAAELVAVKVIPRVDSDAVYRRATRELRAFAAVSSPYLARLLDAGQDGTCLFYAMEYFPLGSLAAPARPLPRAETVRAVAHAALAAHALHEGGIVHRDIKPANIMLHDDGARLSDLGLAQFLAPGMTVTGMGPVISVEYLDPGVLRGERPSRATDVWSLGVTLHRVLTGKGIYGELSDRDPLLAIRTVLSSTPQLDGSLAPGSPGRSLIEACLDPTPSSRPKTAHEVAERLDHLASKAG